MAGALVVVAGAALTLAMSNSNTASATAYRSRIPAYRPIGGYVGKCIHISGERSVDGARLVLWDCNGSLAQGWAFSGGRVLALGKCMHVAWGSTANRAAIQLANCNGAWPCPD